MKEKIVEKFQTHFKEAIESIDEFRGELTVVVKKNDIVRICQFFRDDPELQFDSLRDICGADYYRPTDRFEVIYNLYSLKNKFRFRIKVKVDENDLHVPSVTGVWSTADWHERETYDMYGIFFDGHSDLRRIYMPEEFEYYPLRKDFPLMGIPGSLPLPHK
ncbi:MAG TPA: NADH-quinone oxidoreductase subunit C [Bacteroidota bacterium]|nr:NADH-quinone oxidoreductase subunit C [Bacteroidota bacterium]